MMKLFSIIFLLCLLGCQSGESPSISIEPLKDYALKYNPCLEGDDCAPFYVLPDVPEAVAHILETNKFDNDLILYNTLIMLKLYRAQIERAHQGYDLIGDFGKSYNPILLAFEKYSGMSMSGEFVSSTISYHWAKGQASINTNPYIAEEIERIAKTLSDIENGVFWK